MTDARTILAKLRDGGRLSGEELSWFADGLASGAVTDAQAGAFAMAVCARGLGERGRAHLTTAMRDTGDVLEWDLDGPVIDKHSTGGIGDATSLLLAPALAACGAYVPMISGRGLGHTGGTLDKLSAIPGYEPEAPVARLREVVAEAGCAIVGASDDIAPADRRLYAVRDVTGTVESIDLTTASIMSKKLAAGLEALVLDVKVGSGAFMATPDEARALAAALVGAARGAGCAASALVTDMNQPLAPAAGNALEVIEVMEILTGGDLSGPLARLAAALGGEVLALGGLAADAADGEARVAAALRDGRAAEAFGRMAAALGGPVDFLESWRERLPAAASVTDVFPEADGAVAAIDARALGEAVVRLGGGRLRQGDRIDHSVGLSRIARIGDMVGPDAPLLRVHAADEAAAREAARAVRAAFAVGDGATEPPPLVHERIG